jgi:hypothetical protein
LSQGHSAAESESSQHRNHGSRNTAKASRREETKGTVRLSWAARHQDMRRDCPRSKPSTVGRLPAAPVLPASFGCKLMSAARSGSCLPRRPDYCVFNWVRSRARCWRGHRVPKRERQPPLHNRRPGTESDAVRVMRVPTRQPEAWPGRRTATILRFQRKQCRWNSTGEGPGILLLRSHIQGMPSRERRRQPWPCVSLFSTRIPFALPSADPPGGSR